MNISINKIQSVCLITLLLFNSLIFSQFNIPPEITATGRQLFCPGNAINIVENFNITDVDDNSIDFFYIQISSGYQFGTDRLELTGNHPNIVTSWNQQEGKLTLSGIGGSRMTFPDLINAVESVTYNSSVINVLTEKTFSLTVDNANYLPSTGNFYVFISDVGITWSSARAAAENTFFYGRRGYLATFTSQEEADFAGKQASGAGWIGGTDEETEGVWKWVTGPEAGTVFWNGSPSGTTPNFAFWNSGEPNNNNGNEHYAHITDSSIGIDGSWNDLPNEGGTGPFEPKGYIVEYGPFLPPLKITASTSIYLPEITNTSNGSVCESGLVTISATASEGVIHWYDTADITNTQEIAVGNDLTVNVNQNSIYYASISINGCNTLPRIPVTVTVNQRPTITNVQKDLICSGSAVLNATASDGEVYWYETATSTTPIFIGNSFSTPDIASTTSYYVEARTTYCTSSIRTEVTAEVDATIPSFDVLQTNAVICKNIGNVTLETINAQGNYSYVWKKEGVIIPGDLGSISVNETGSYSVTAISEAGCSSDEQFIQVVASEKATITKDDIIIIDDSNNNSIQIGISNLGSGNYEFAVDNSNGPFQNLGFFENLTTGVHTLYVRDKGGCGTEEYQFSILAYPRFFTPNNDGENDFWTIDGFDTSFYTSVNIYIYNRYGNLLYSFSQNSVGWDGNYGSKKLPESTYWFRVRLTDINGYSIEKFGSISLIR